MNVPRDQRSVAAAKPPAAVRVRPLGWPRWKLEAGAREITERDGATRARELQRQRWSRCAGRPDDRRWRLGLQKGWHAHRIERVQTPVVGQQKRAVIRGD